MPNDRPKTRRVEYTPVVLRPMRALKKKYPHIREDIEPIIWELGKGATPGDQITGTGYAVCKERIRNSDLQKGKSSGYRLIYLLKDVQTVVLVAVYSKLEQNDISAGEIRRILKEFEGR